jgi:hypothetical protein
MAIALTDDGNFLTKNGRLTTAQNPPFQNYKSEVRCIQNTYPPDLTFGRNTLVWTLSQSVRDRCADLVRIGDKYLPVKSVTYNTERQEYQVLL